MRGIHPGKPNDIDTCIVFKGVSGYILNLLVTVSYICEAKLSNYCAWHGADSILGILTSQHLYIYNEFRATVNMVHYAIQNGMIIVDREKYY